jgi:protein-disulfide isomerase
MSRKHGSFVVLVVVALLAVACGPEMPTTVPTEGAAAVESPTVGKTPTTVAKAATTAAPTEAPTQEEPAAPTRQSAPSGDVHSLGSPDAPVTMIEYSDFQ